MDALDQIPIQKNTRVRIDAMYGFRMRVVEFIDRVVVFLGLRKKRQFWGVIYDSVNKQPLDPAIVKMAYIENGNVIETCVTDLEGRYGFLARPGRFKILAQKTNYRFPSEFVKGTSDGIYEDLYHGEFFTLTDDSEVVAPNIPMDPLQKDWNQEAKASVVRKSPIGEYFVRRLVGALFWFVFIYDSIYLFLMPNVWVYALWGVYVVFFLFAYFTPQVRLWGTVIDAHKNEPQADILLELVIPNLNNMVLAKTKTNESGKYFLRANSGHYTLMVKQLKNGVPIRLLGSAPVTINKSKIMNQRIYIEWG